MNTFLYHLYGQRSHHFAQHTRGPPLILVVASPTAGGNTHMLMIIFKTSFKQQHQHNSTSDSAQQVTSNHLLSAALQTVVNQFKEQIMSSHWLVETLELSQYWTQML